MNRSLCAPSDQNDAFTEYGITPGFTLWPATVSNSPLSLELLREAALPVSRGLGVRREEAAVAARGVVADEQFAAGVGREPR